MLVNLLIGFIVILIGLTLTPSIANAIVQTSCGGIGCNASNVTGITYTLVSLTTVFWAIGVVSIGISFAVNGLKQAGMM
jgi:hypothetical protein